MIRPPRPPAVFAQPGPAWSGAATAEGTATAAGAAATGESAIGVNSVEMAKDRLSLTARFIRISSLLFVLFPGQAYRTPAARGFRQNDTGFH